MKNFLSNENYDRAKWVAQVGLPALGTFIFALSQLYNWDWGAVAVGTITAVDVLLGSLLGLASREYNKSFEGEFEVNPPDGEDVPYRLKLNATPEELAQQSRISFKVVNKA